MIIQRQVSDRFWDHALTPLLTGRG